MIFSNIKYDLSSRYLVIGAPKFYCPHFFRVVIILFKFNTGLYTCTVLVYSFAKLRCKAFAILVSKTTIL